MKILFYITSSMEKASPSYHLMKALLEDVLEAGIEVHAIQRHYEKPQYPTAFPETILNNPNFSYSSVDSRDVVKNAMVKRYLGGITYALKTRKELKNHDDYDLVFVQSAPTSLFYLMTVRHYAKKRPVIYNSQDMFPGSAIASGVMPKKWMQKIFFWLQKKAYKKADIITAISEDMKTKLLEQGVSEVKIHIIVNWYDDQAVREIPWEENRFVEKYSLSRNKFYVQYAGTMGNVFNYPVILDLAEKLKTIEQIEFQMIGQGIKREPFENEAKQRGLSNIKFLPLQPQDMVADVYSACDICLIPLKRGVIGNSVPSKAGLLMACRRVILNSVDAGTDYYEMFEREQVGVSADQDDSEKLADAIVRLCSNPDELNRLGEQARQFSEKYYSRSANTKRYIALFKDLCG